MVLHVMASTLQPWNQVISGPLRLELSSVIPLCCNFCRFVQRAGGKGADQIHRDYDCFYLGGWGNPEYAAVTQL